MCGIAGYISSGQNDGVSVVTKMTDAIKHRGPDGFGYKSIGNVTIGHRRLSIIDIATGSQPMCTESGNTWITYNGELYNYIELKKELELSGIVFKTKSDTEVILYAYEKWGTSCLTKFRGMFAFGIIDNKNRKVLLARDHFGIKPIYIYNHNKIIAFGSELQQFRNLPGFNSTLNEKALDNFLWLQYIPAPLTIFKSIQKLKPAHYVTISFDGKLSEQIEYWNVSYSKKQIKTKKEWLDATSSTIKESVKSHLISDVPFGAFLSGGIDSTLIVKYMSEILDKPVKTFSIGFDDENYNELKFSEQAAKKYGTEHYTEVIQPNALQILPKLVKHYGEPFGDSSALPTYYVCELAKKHVTMVLSGDGGDEGFAGYHSYISWMQSLPVNYRTGFKKKLYPYLEKVLPNKYEKKDTLNNWLSFINYLDTNWRNRLWRNDVKPNPEIFPESFEANFNYTSGFSPANKVQYMDMKTYMPFDILTKVDTASMIHSLEVRTPLIDKEVWEFSSSIPEEFLINSSGGKWEGKQLLKQLLQQDFPSDFIYRKKQGFAVPLEKWFSDSEEFITSIQDKLLSRNSVLINYFNESTIKDLVQSKHTQAIWLLLFLEEWLQQFHSNNNEL